MLDESKPEILSITEIRPKALVDFNPHEYQIPGYDMFINKIPKRGVALYILQELNAQECDILNNTEFEESVWCHIQRGEQRVLIGNIYRSPNSDATNNENLLSIFSNQEITSKLYDKIIITGDFNFPSIDWNCNMSTNTKDIEFIEVLRDAYLSQMVTEPTRHREGQKSNLLDLILVNDEDFISDINHQSPIGKSDHEVLTFSLYLPSSKIQPNSHYTYNLSKGNYDRMRKEIRDIDWTILEGKSVEDSWLTIKDIIHTKMEDCIPKSKTHKNARKTTPTWMNKKNLRLIKKKYKLYKRFLSTNAGRDYQKYIETRNECKREVKKSKRQHEKKIVNNIKSNPKQFWKYVQNKLKSTSGISPLDKKDGEKAISDEDKANVLNDFFASVFTKENFNDFPHVEAGVYSNGITLTDIRVTQESVKQKLLNLDPNKAQGPDKVPARVLKELSDELSLPFCLLFNKSIEDGYVPSDWKSAEVVAIFKKGKRSDPGNYRPVSLTCISSKNS